MVGHVLQDKHGRRMRKLRISLLDACNMRCVYCMPEKPHFTPQEDWASAEEIVRIAGHLCALGIEEIRLTGGEPTLRADMLAIAEGLSGLGARKLGLTSNGLLLGEKLEALKTRTDLRFLNISMDSLDRDNFARITRKDVFETVHGTILKARDMGFSVKVNVVALRGLNDHEVLDFVDWSGREGVAVRFLEAMNIGVMEKDFAQRLIPAREMIGEIRKHYKLTAQVGEVDATAYTFVADNGADVGFIASESEPFCGNCSRLRLTAQGHLRPCLFTHTGINLKGVAFEHYPAAIASILDLKPGGRMAHVAQPMYQIGG